MAIALWQAVLTAVILWWMSHLARMVVQSLNKTDDTLTTENPVFGRVTVGAAYDAAVLASKDLQRVEGIFLRDDAFKQACNKHAIPKDVSKQMLEVMEALVRAEGHWYRHAAMLDANVDVLTGRRSRAEALAEAQQRIEKSFDSFDMDAMKLRDEWKARLEDANAPATDPPPRAYSNPWFDRAHRYTYSPHGDT